MSHSPQKSPQISGTFAERESQHRMHLRHPVSYCVTTQKSPQISGTFAERDLQHPMHLRHPVALLRDYDP